MNVNKHLILKTTISEETLVTLTILPYTSRGKPSVAMRSVRLFEHAAFVRHMIHIFNGKDSESEILRVMILKEIGRFFVFIAIFGLASHVFGESIRRDSMHYDRFPFAPYKWEDGGQFYKKLRIESWKTVLPDKSRYVRSMVKKSIEGNDMTSAHIASLISETCVAELVHVLLFFAGPLLWLWLGSKFGLVASILYSLSHVPFIMIQRYNRPRLVALHRKILMREALVCENTHLVQQ